MSLFHLQSKIGPTIYHEGNEFLYFSGTSYLGMGSEMEFEDLVIKGIKKYGLGHGLSRINNVRLTIYEQFESFFAEKAGSEKALVMSSGFLSGITAVSCLKKQVDHILVAPDTHPAIFPDDLPMTKQSFKEWITWSQSVCESLPAQKILLLANAVDPLKSEVHDFSWIGYLPRKHRYTLLIDDSHAFGVLGDDIFGTYTKWRYLPVELVVSGSLGKGLGIPAGIILGDTTSLLNIGNQNMFRASSPPPPGFLYAFLEGQHIYRNAFKKLKYNLEFFTNLIKLNHKVTGNATYPVFTFTSRNWVRLLEEKGIVVSSFPYPEPTDPWANRIVISAYHEKEELELLAKFLNNIQFQETGSVLNS